MGQKRLPRLPPGTPQSSPRNRAPPSTAGSGSGSASLPALSPRSPRSSRGSSGGSRETRRSVGAFARHQGDAGDTTRSRPDIFSGRSPRKRTIEIRAGQSADGHPLGAYNGSPRRTTNTQMRIDRREADKPHPSMDVDGDGTVSAFDLKLAKRFDDDGNGILDEEETANLRAMMAKQNVKDIATMMDASGKTDQDFEAIKKNILQGGEQSELQEADKHLTGEEVMLMRNAFAAVDEDQSGKIDSSELCSISERLLGKKMTEEESNQILAEVDADHSGQVDFDEFKLYWVKAKQAGPEGNKIFGGMDLASDEFRLKIDKLAAQARKMQQVYASSGASGVMDQTAIVNPAGSVPGKLYGEHVNDLAEYQKHLQIYGENFAQADGSGEAMTGDKADELSRARPHANLGPKTHLVNGVLVEGDEVEEALGGDTTPPPEAARDSTPELWTKGSDVFRMVAAKIESKTSNVAKLFRKFDIDGDGTVDYRELRKGLADMGVEIEDQQFKELCELIDEDRSGDIDYQEFANADVMGSRLFKARSVQGNSGASTVTQLQYKRGQSNRTFAHYRTNEHYERYMHGGLEGVFGKRPDDTTLAADHAEHAQLGYRPKDAAVALRVPWATDFPHDPRNSVERVHQQRY